MGKITYPDKVAGNQFFGTEATEIKDVVNANDDAATLFVEAWSTSIRADKKRTHATPETMSGNMTLTWDPTGAVDGGGEIKKVTGDGGTIFISAPIGILYPSQKASIITNVDEDLTLVFLWDTTNLLVSVDGQTTTAPASIILMQDDFAGTTIDTAKWTVTDPADGVTISQNDGLIFTTTGADAVSWNNNTVIGIDNVPEAKFAFAVDVVSITGGSSKDRGLGVISNAGLTRIRIRAKTDDITTQVYFADSAGTVQSNFVEYAIQFEGKTWRIRIESGTLYFEYWNGSSWMILDSIATGGLIDADLESVINCGDNGPDDAGTMTYDNAYLTSEGYLTQYPS